MGNSGAGKSTLGRALAQRLEVPFLELDALAHQPGWTLLPDEPFAARIDAVTRENGWVVDGNYTRFRHLIWDRADTVVWFDLPRPVATWRIVRRTSGRLLRRHELWNGNRERLRNLVSRQPGQNIILWSIANHRRYGERYAAAAHDPRWRHLRFVRIRSAADARRLLASAW